MAARDSDIKTPPPRSSRSKRVPARMTLREFEAFDVDPDQKWELIEGVAFMTQSPTGPHNDLAAELRNFVRGALSPDHGWYVILDRSVRLPIADTELRPDLAAYRQADLGDESTGPVTARPALVIECLSPSTAHRDVAEKLNAYHKAKVPEYWVVDPKTGAISLFVRKKAGYEQLSVDPKGFIKSPLLKKSLRIVVKRWTFEILEA
ncbi:MAG: Uma2 family endonuclease [Planctomycetes bacterium]|nr:Uma2 family endonuclease [Planctomycetota bacterium]